MSLSPADVDLSVQIGSLRLKNPVMVASGTFGYGPEYAELVDLNRLGALVVKGIFKEPTRGNPTDRTFETACGMMNAIGLPNPGVDGFVEKFMAFLRGYDTPVIVNIWGKTVEDYAEVARRFDAVEGVHGLEINVSCPNIKEGSSLFGTNLDLFRGVVEAVRAETKLPVIPKLAPNVSDIKAYARTAEEAGADALSLINSFPSLAIDIKTRRPRIANVTGGLSGPAIKPIALKLVWEAASAVDIPVIGMGGIFTAEDAAEFFIAGASAVAIGTANFVNPRASLEVIDGIAGYLAANGLRSIGELVGTLEV
jgi:dihydroorotate dehydrogenase (NAD+) catalytic subunit